VKAEAMSYNTALLGRYRLETLLGRSNATETFRARLLAGLPGEQTQSFAIKLLRQGEHRAEVELRFIAAARQLQRTALAGTASVVEIGDSAGAVFAAFLFEEGVNLLQLRAQAVPKGSPMDPRLAGIVVRKLAERLVLLHARPEGLCVHGGLSPGNVLVRPSGDLVLLDGGLAEALRVQGSWPSESWRYAAPEQLRGEPATPASDLYAVGALMHFLLYGGPPFAAETPEELATHIAAGSLALDGLHPAFAFGLRRMLAHAPEARPKTAVEIVRQISAAMLTAHAGVGHAAPALRSEQAEPDQASPAEDAPSDSVGALVAEPEAEGETGWENDEAAPDLASSTLGEQADAADEQLQPIAADDPDVGVVYDEDDDEEEIEIGPDGKVKRRRRRGGIRLLAWTKTALARKLFRYAWIPAGVVLVVGAVEGYFFLQSWRATREQNLLRESAAAAERARLEAAKPKLAPAPAIPKGHLALKINPPGAAVWLDGKEAGLAPMTMLTQPGSHRLVVTAPGYRMLRDVIDTTNGAVFEREMVPAIFPLTGAVGVNVGCTTEGKYPVLIDGKEIGAYCPIAGIRLDPGKHLVGVFVIPENRVWTQEREILPDHPHRVHFNY
jgi:hypothetical protein